MRAVAEEIEEARKAGKITDEEAREKLGALRRRVADSGKANDQRMRRQKYADAERKLKKAVEAGELSEEAAKNRLMQFKNRPLAGQRIRQNPVWPCLTWQGLLSNLSLAKLLQFCSYYS
jgi:hypothetical protein